MLPTNAGFPGDIEKLRKTAKKVGLAMAEDPELKDDIIEPLKLQGVADIDDIATIMRFLPGDVAELA